MKLSPKRQSARLEVLAEVNRLGGTAKWSDLHRRGLHYMTVSSAVLRGDLIQPNDLAYHYKLSDAGRAALERSVVKPSWQDSSIFDDAEGRN